ncbi:hypothetical protein BH11MYX1_BH11MYX1_01420 [soil metagenome]
MSREVQQTTAKPKSAVVVVPFRDAALVHVSGLVDENFAGFGIFGATTKTVVINVTGMTRMTSFGVRQWLKSMDALPKTIADIYLLGCPTFFVDQLNMVLNFGGVGQVLSVFAPYMCPSCGVEAGELIDVLAERAALAKGVVPTMQCQRCGGTLEFDETPESYFSFVTKYAASMIQAPVAEMLAAQNLYIATIDTATEKPPKIIKLVHGSVTYFRIIGSIGSMFRARPFLVGAEGEVVIDLAEVDRFDPLGQREWRRLLKSLAGQVPSVTLVDVNNSFLAVAADSLAIARNIAIWSVLIEYSCIDCKRTSQESHLLEGKSWPLQFPDQVCSRCGGTTTHQLQSNILAPLQKASTATPAASAKLIVQRAEILSRALTDANVAQAGDNASASLNADDTILGKYKIVRLLSSGGMAEVFLAKQVGIGGFEKPVALKRIQRQLLESRHLAIDMFLNEAKIAGRLMHPNIVQVLDVGEVNGALYLAMEYVRGKDLREVIKRLRALGEAMSLGDACFVVHEVAQALHHAYWSQDIAGQRLSVVHRDVSPHNIMLGFDGSVRLLDFGVAMSSVTEQANMVVGKWMYMSPEHTSNQAIDHRSDLFSLGVIFYLMCCGQMPFTGADPKEIVRKTRAGQYVPLEQLVPQIPPPISQLIASMLAPDPTNRPQTGREIAVAIAEIVRTFDLNRSSIDISQFLARLFPADDIEGGVIEIVHSSPRPSEIEALATRKLAVGSGTTQAQSDKLDQSKSPASFAGHTGSESIQSKLSPNELIDASMSLSRRSHEFSTVRSEQTRNLPTLKRTSPTNARRLLIIMAAIFATLLAYLLVRPSW